MLEAPVVTRRYADPAVVVADMHPGSLAGARVCFVNMPLRESALPNNVPLGPGLLAARVREYGADPTILDLNAYRLPRGAGVTLENAGSSPATPGGRHLSYEEADRLMARHFARYGEPDLIAMSGLITTLRWQEQVARIARRLAPGALIAAGGGLASEFRRDLFRWIPDLDAVAHSEGDNVILKMTLDALVLRKHGFKSARARGVLEPYLLGEQAGRPRFLYDGGRPDNLDALPLPAWDLLEEDADGRRILETYLSNATWGGNSNNSSAAPFIVQRDISTVSSRGCPFACKFCYRGQQGERNYGVRSPESLAMEMRHYHERYRVDFVGITDDNFMVIPKRIAALPEALGPVIRDTGLRWGTHGRLDEAADIRPDARAGRVTRNAIQRVECMARAGCVYIGFGAESASPTMLEAMGKGGFMLVGGTVSHDGHDFPLTMVEGVKACKQHDVHANCTWIMGYPGETLADLKTSVAFIRWQEEIAAEGLPSGSGEERRAIAAVNKRMFTATAYPGTEMFKHPRVREKLSECFGIRFDVSSGEPKADDALRAYVLELDDATKLLQSPDGCPLNFSAMSDSVFLEARALVDAGRTFDVLNMG